MAWFEFQGQTQSIASDPFSRPSRGPLLVHGLFDFESVHIGEILGPGTRFFVSDEKPEEVFEVVR